MPSRRAIQESSASDSCQLEHGHYRNGHELNSPLPGGERSTRIVRCAAGEGSFCVERPLTRSLRWRSGFELSPQGRGEKEPLQSKFITRWSAMTGLPTISVAETLGRKIAALKPGVLPASTTRKCEDLLIDVVGLCVTARNEDYIRSALDGCDDDGACTAIGHARTLTASGAAFINGTAAHGEDFDDTFEGGPVHAGAVVVPAVLAA